MSKTKPITASWYDYPQYYDLAFRSETRLEADFLEAAARKYCDFPVRRMFEPACGTGRLVTEMAARGYRMTGLDVSRPSLAYLRRRLTRRGLKATLLEADMADFRLAAPVDLAFCTFNGFRHLLAEQAAKRHLECVGKILRPGGIYVLGLHLVPSDADGSCVERWTERHGGTRVTVTFRVLATDRRRRLETVRVSLLVRSRGNQFRLRDEFPLRLYTAAQLRRLLAKVPSLELAEVFDFWYEIDRPLKLDDEISDTVLVLRKKGGTQDHEEVRSRKRRRVSAGRDRLLHGLTIEG